MKSLFLSHQFLSFLYIFQKERLIDEVANEILATVTSEVLAGEVKSVAQASVDEVKHRAQILDDAAASLFELLAGEVVQEEVRAEVGRLCGGVEAVQRLCNTHRLARALQQWRASLAQRRQLQQADLVRDHMRRARSWRLWRSSYRLRKNLRLVPAMPSLLQPGRQLLRLLGPTAQRFVETCLTLLTSNQQEATRDRQQQRLKRIRHDRLRQLDAWQPLDLPAVVGAAYAGLPWTLSMARRRRPEEDKVSSSSSSGGGAGFSGDTAACFKLAVVVTADSASTTTGSTRAGSVASLLDGQDVERSNLLDAWVCSRLGAVPGRGMVWPETALPGSSSVYLRACAVSVAPSPVADAGLVAALTGVSALVFVVSESISREDGCPASPQAVNWPAVRARFARTLDTLHPDARVPLVVLHAYPSSASSGGRRDSTAAQQGVFAAELVRQLQLDALPGGRVGHCVVEGVGIDSHAMLADESPQTLSDCLVWLATHTRPQTDLGLRRATLSDLLQQVLTSRFLPALTSSAQPEDLVALYNECVASCEGVR